MLTDELEPHGLIVVTRRVRRGNGQTAPWRELRPAVVLPIVGPLSAIDEAEVRAAGIPIVPALLSPVAPDDGTSVGQIMVGRLQVEHLAARGHTVLGYAAPDDERVSAFFRLRLEGVRLACMELGLDEPDVIRVPLEVPGAVAAVSRWCSASEPVTAVCAYNDEVAFAVLAAMRRLGLDAPRDLAVIGVDNIPLAPLVDAAPDDDRPGARTDGPPPGATGPQRRSRRACPGSPPVRCRHARDPRVRLSRHRVAVRCRHARDPRVRVSRRGR